MRFATAIRKRTTRCPLTGRRLSPDARILLLILAWLTVRTPCLGASPWPAWRGPAGTGVAASGSPPIVWSETENIKWKTELPGLGHSSPVVAGDLVFLTTAIPTGEKLPPKYSNAPGAHDNLPITQRQEFVALAVNRDDGKIVWKTKLHEALPHEGGHQTASLASASPVTNGQYVVAHFGSYGTYCLDLAGKVIWKKSLGRMHSKHGHGEGSSPALFDSTVVVNWDHEGQSFIVALDIKSGNEIWRAARDEVTSWSSPLILTHDGTQQVVVCGTTRVRAYDLADGRVIWECGGLSANVVATPVAADGMVYVGSSYEIRSMFAINLQNAKGDITGTDAVVWSRRERTPYVPSPILYGDGLYFLRHYQGILTRVDARTGEEPSGPFRLGALRDIYASPVGADGRIYFTDLYGVTQVVSHGKLPRPLAINRLDDSFSASAAIVGDEILLRGRRYLYCIADSGDE